MGGRGSNLEVKQYLNKQPSQRTSEYRCAYSEGNIEFLVQNAMHPISAPVFSNTPGRIYVTLKRNGEIYEVTQYGFSHEKDFSISLGHANEPYIHEHGPHPLRTKLLGDQIPREHMQLLNRVIEIYNKKVRGSV